MNVDDIEHEINWNEDKWLVNKDKSDHLKEDKLMEEEVESDKCDANFDQSPI